MRGCLFILLIGIGSLVPRSAAAQTHDPWWGQDKALHLSFSLAISATSYGIAIPLLDAPEARVLFAASIGLSAGVGKELLDLAGYGDPSWKDFAWDVIGVAIGTAIMWTLDILLSDGPRRSATDAQRARVPNESS